MNSDICKENNKEEIIKKVCEFLQCNKPVITSSETTEIIKEICVARLCGIVGLTGRYNYKSKFFNFFSSIMGEAISLKLNLKIRIASDELRLFKYERINLIDETIKYLNTESIEEAFLDTFELADKFKDIV